MKKISRFLFQLNLKLNRFVPDRVLNHRLPDFLIIGAGKCATTFLKDNLRNHPDVYMPHKEVGYFTANQDQGLTWYKSHFWSQKPVQGEKSPSYIYDTTCHSRIHEIVPEAKLVLLLREPVARAFSNWNMRMNNGRLGHLSDGDSRDFNQLIDSYLLRLDDNAEVCSNPYDIIDRGRYAEGLASLLTFFPRDSIHIGIFERIMVSKKSKVSFLQSICEFLQVDFNENYFALQKIRGGNYQSRKIDPKDKEKLKSFYKPYNEKLFNLLGYSIDEWRV